MAVQAAAAYLGVKPRFQDGRLTLGGLNIVLNYLFFLRFGLIGIAYSTLVVECVGCALYSVVAYTVLREQRYLV